MIIRSNRLSSKIAVQPFVTGITSMLKDLNENYLADDDCYFLPHIRNSNNKIHRRMISLTLVEIFNHGEISRLKKKFLH